MATRETDRPLLHLIDERASGQLRYRRPTPSSGARPTDASASLAAVTRSNRRILLKRATARLASAPSTAPRRVLIFHFRQQPFSYPGYSTARWDNIGFLLADHECLWQRGGKFLGRLPGLEPWRWNMNVVALMSRIKDCRIPKHLVFLLPLTAVASGCTTLPSNGPTAGRIINELKKNDSELNISLVDLTSTNLAEISHSEPSSSGSFASFSREGESDPRDMIRPGDTLSIAIYEVGVSLFSSQSAAGMEVSTQVNNPMANAQRINGVQVDETGGIQLPYVGYITVAGLTPRGVENIVEQRLQGMSQSPRALVSIADSLNSTVYLSGAVNKPGRYRLTLARETLRDYIAIAGGTAGDAEDFLVRVTRGRQTAEMRLGDISVGSADDILMLPGDQVEVLRRPRSYTVFGASDKVSQVPFDAGNLVLAEAIARVGGPSDARANPRGIFLFRLLPSTNGKAPTPTIYRLNMMDPASYFVAQQVAMRDKDLLYFANSASSPPTKLIGIINMLFGPFVTARALTQ